MTGKNCRSEMERVLPSTGGARAVLRFLSSTTEALWIRYAKGIAQRKITLITSGNHTINEVSSALSNLLGNR